MKANIQLDKKQIDKIVQDEIDRLVKRVKTLERQIESRDKKIEKLKCQVISDKKSAIVSSIREFINDMETTLNEDIMLRYDD
jgi:chaperonin cofactor prefoldin|tara:strand:+ start:998 stop:1243 length:246 start_codon:yes stop_codon:yes gene_type:complete